MVHEIIKERSAKNLPTTYKEVLSFFEEKCKKIVFINLN